MGVVWDDTSASMSTTVEIFLYSAMLLGDNGCVHGTEWLAYWRCLLLGE